ncbi:hypothetical protein F5B20DRAFT_501182 [Whalleya microplaca]|nr:hypothetical protein F5B20DRAFT_501182 [Whalleya microplaca]
MVPSPLTATVTGAVAPRATPWPIHDGTHPVDALTTIWTPGPGCYPLSTAPSLDINSFWTKNTECGPPRWTDYIETYYYSPAICPSGWTVGCERYTSIQGPHVEASETAMLCVPSGYSCTPAAWNYYATNTAIENVQIMIQIRWAETDIPMLETHPLTPGLKPLKPLATPGTGTNSSPGSTVTVHAGSGSRLSTAAQAGIGVGVGLLGLLAFALGGFLIWRYRKRRREAGGLGPNNAMQQAPGAGAYRYPYMRGPGQPAQGYPDEAGYTEYVDPKTGAVTYYAPVPQPSELAGRAVEGYPPAPISELEPTHPRESTLLGGWTPSPMMTAAGTSAGTSAGNAANYAATEPVEMPGNEGVGRSEDGSESGSPRAQQETGHLILEQSRLEERRTRPGELEDLGEEEQRIRTRTQELQGTIR